MMGVLIIGYLKYAAQVITKVFFVVIFAVIVMAIGTWLFDADFDFGTADILSTEVATSYFQHMPFIGKLADGILQMINSVSKPFGDMGKLLCSEILFCCVYLLIIKIFDFAIWIGDGFCGFFMGMGEVLRILVNISVCIAAYGLAVPMADCMYNGIVSKVDVEIAYIIFAALVIAIPVLLMILRRNGVLGIVLKVIVEMLLDVVQLVMIYIMMTGIVMLNAAEAEYLSSGENAMITSMVFASALILSVMFIKQLLAKAKK